MRTKRETRKRERGKKVASPFIWAQQCNPSLVITKDTSLKKEGERALERKEI